MAATVVVGLAIIVSIFRTRRSASVDDVKAQLAAAGYLASDAIATTVYLASELGKPLLIEGPAGVGKSRLAAEFVTANCFCRKQVLTMLLEPGDSLDTVNADYPQELRNELKILARTVAALGER